MADPGAGSSNMDVETHSPKLKDRLRKRKRDMTEPRPGPSHMHDSDSGGDTEMRAVQDVRRRRNQRESSANANGSGNARIQTYRNCLSRNAHSANGNDDIPNEAAGIGFPREWNLQEHLPPPNIFRALENVTGALAFQEMCQKLMMFVHYTFIEKLYIRFGEDITWTPRKIENIMYYGCRNLSVVTDVIYPAVAAHLHVLVLSDPIYLYVQMARMAQFDFSVAFRTIPLLVNDVPPDAKNTCHKIFSFFFLDDYSPSFWGPKFNQILRPGGKVFVIMIRSNPIVRAATELSKTTAWRSFLVSYPEVASSYQPDPVGWLRFELAEHLNVERCEILQEKLLFFSLESLLAHLFTIDYIPNTIPPHLHTAYSSDLMTELLKEMNVADFPKLYTLKFEFILLVASTRKLLPS